MAHLTEFQLGYFGVDSIAKAPKDPAQFLKTVAAAASVIFDLGLLESSPARRKPPSTGYSNSHRLRPQESMTYHVECES